MLHRESPCPPPADYAQHNLGERKAPKGSKLLQVGPEVLSASEDRATTAATTPSGQVFRGRLKGKYMNGVMRRGHERLHAAISARPLVGAAKERLLAGRTFPERKAVVADNAALRYRR